MTTFQIVVVFGGAVGITGLMVVVAWRELTRRASAAREQRRTELIAKGGPRVGPDYSIRLLTPAHRAYVRARIDQYAEETSDKERWLLPFVKELRVLPLQLGWFESVGIQEDGSIVRWNTEHEWDGLRPVERLLHVNMALVEGAKRHPALRDLIPSRPPDAITCATCKGSGVSPWRATADARAICSCGGTGWLPALSDA